jgi:N-methylhydantoinase B
VFGTFASHGVLLPNLTGVQGGYPGSVCGYEVARGSDWLERMARQEPPLRMDSIGGRHEWLPAKGAVQMRRGGVMNNIVQNAGGYGGPLLRDPARVADNVREGRSHAEVAAQVYGVVLDGGGAVDAAATGRRREGIRAHRRETLQRARDQGDGSTRIRPEQVAHRWGGAILFTKDGRVGCGHCGTEIGSFHDNWREAVPARNPAAEELGPHLTLDEQFVYDQHVCPHCATSLFVDVRKRDRERTRDFVLADARGG